MFLIEKRVIRGLSLQFGVGLPLHYVRDFTDESIPRIMQIGGGDGEASSCE